MTLNDLLQTIHALREDLLTFERKYGVPTELFYKVYQQGEEPTDQAWVLDWSQWAGSYETLQELLRHYDDLVNQMLQENQVMDLSHLIERTARHEPIALSV